MERGEELTTEVELTRNILSPIRPLYKNGLTETIRMDRVFYSITHPDTHELGNNKFNAVVCF